MSTITDFPLIWRWTSPTHALFSASELALLHPCSPAEAAYIYDGLPFKLVVGFDPRQFGSLSLPTGDLSVAEGCAWLRARAGHLAEPVTVSWDRDTALHTTWELFTARWDDFCYPFDRVVVLPASGMWRLLYHHSEAFYFGTRDT